MLAGSVSYVPMRLQVAALLAICAGPAISAPAQITCAYDPFVAGAHGPVVQRLILDGDAYVDADFSAGLRFDLTEDRIALYLVETAGGAITAFAIEKIGRLHA